jgi:GNAT superfamily N-acetyltransferase
VTYGPVVPITPSHVTDRFDCGSAAQTLWLRRYALQAHRTDSSRVRVVTHEGDQDVVGYYALSAGAVEPAGVPARVAKGMPRYPIPVVILTRLGVHLEEQGRGLGRALLRDALVRVAAASEEIAARALLVHCEDDGARRFYERFGELEPSPADPLHLYLLMSDLRRTLAPPEP